MISFNTHTRRARLGIATSASALLAAAMFLSTTAAAQTSTVDARWQPFLGCWVPDATSAAIGTNAVSGSMVCVVPVASSQSVDVATINNRVVVHRERITTGGERVTKKADDCPGWESANWSADGHRIFMRSEYACGSNVNVKGSGVFAIASNGDWVQVQGTTIGLNAGARVVRFRAADVALAPGSMITDSSTVTTVPAQMGFAAQAIRSAAGAPTDTKALLDIAKNVDEQVAQAWLSEFGVATKLNAQQIVAMADAGMPSTLTDMMVAMANPERFQLRTRSPEGQTSTSTATASNNNDVRCRDAYLDPFYDVSPMMSFDRAYCLRRYGSAYGYLTGLRYGWGNYGYGYGNGYGGSYYYGSQPVVIVVRNPDASEPTVRGRAVKGGGYSSGRTSGSSSSTRESSSSGSSSGSSSASSGSGATSSGSSSGSSSAGGSAASGGDAGARTAKPRTPPPNN